MPEPKGSRTKVILVAAVVAAVAVVVLLLRGPAPSSSGEPAAPAQAKVETPVATQAPASVPNFLPPPGPKAGPKLAPRPDTEACTRCEEDNRGKECKAEMGCQGLPAEDKVLCENLLGCLQANTECMMFNLVKCYCGTTTGTDCARIPNGPCAAEVMAAAKTTSAVDAGIRFYKTDFPVGRATQKMVCQKKTCKDTCLPK